MILKTELIVLKTIRFQDNHQIINSFTKEFGAKSFLIKGAYSQNLKKSRFAIQPMSILEVVFYDKPGRDLQIISDYNYIVVYESIMENPYKISTTMLFVDICRQFFGKMEHPDLEIYQTLYQFLILTDKHPNIFHIFLFHLLKINNLAGYTPLIPKNQLKNIYFDIERAVFEEGTENKNYESDKLIYHFLTHDLSDLYNYLIPNILKRNTIELIFRYFTLKVDHFEIPKSYEIFKEIL